MARKARKTEKPCKICSKVYPIGKLSNNGQCYRCSRDRMLDRFNEAWSWKHSRPFD